MPDMQEYVVPVRARGIEAFLRVKAATYEAALKKIYTIVEALKDGTAEISEYKLERV